MLFVFFCAQMIAAGLVRRLTTMAALLFCCGLVSANSWALIRSKTGQPLTSSTLYWQSSGRGIPDETIEGGQPNTYVCRFQHAGRLQVGETTEDESHCRIIYFERIIQKDKYEVLVNGHKAGRVVWSDWDRSRVSLEGAVQVGEHYVARAKVVGSEEEEGYQLGRLDTSTRRGLILTIQQDEVVEATEGQILLEMEPVEYELGLPVTARQRRKILNDEQVQLAHTILDHMEDGSEEQTVASSLSYIVNHSVYLGQMRSMVKGLQTSIMLNGGQAHFLWGNSSISGSFPQIVDVSLRLARGTAVNVTVAGRRITFDGPFNAQLNTTYSDGFIARRQVDGQARQTLLEDVKLHYSEAYFIGNGSIVPLTTTTPQPTTTTTTSTTTEAPPSTELPKSIDDSSVTSPPSSSKQTKETLELKSRKSNNSNVSSGSGSHTTNSSIKPIVVFLLIVIESLLMF